MPAATDIRVLAAPAELFAAAAGAFVEVAQAAVTERGSCQVALAGGSTPRALYALLADSGAKGIPWPSIGWFWGDERCVPPTHPDSNFRMAHDALLSKVPVAASAIHRIEAERADPAGAAAAYERTLRAELGAPAPELPRFDLVLLGMGADGHTASLFPGSSALAERSRLVAATVEPRSGTSRITLTLPVLNAAATVLFLVSGPDKRAAVQAVLGAHAAASALPASLVRPTDGRLLWLLDEAAAGRGRIGNG
jgi:6-phosphogluconolactonase